MKSVLDFGAKPEQPGVDSWEAFQRALDSRQAVSVPSARYWIKRPLGAGEGASLIGEATGPNDSMVPPWEKAQAPTLLITHDQGPAITGWGNGVGLERLTIAYPDQVKADDKAVGTQGPRVYPPTIHARGITRIVRCHLPNSYRGIVVNCGRTYITACNIGGMRNDIEIDNAWDVVMIDGGTVMSLAWSWRLSPFNNPLFWWVMNNGVGITAHKADGLKVNNAIVCGRNTGIFLDENPDIPEGAPSGTVTDLNLDTVRNGVVARATHQSVGVEFKGLLLGPYWDDPPQGYAISLLAGATHKPRINVLGGSIRLKWRERFRRDAGELYIRDMLSADNEGKPAGVINTRLM